MAKLKAGLLSLGARGTIGDAVTFQERGQVNFARTKPIPQYRRSLAQNYQRWDYEDAIFFWKSLSDVQKAEYRTLGSKLGLTAFAYVIRLYLRTLPDLAGRWRLDEGSGAVAYDSSKQGNNGAIIGASPDTGVIDGAYRFDGINDLVSIAHSSSLSPITGLTIELFLKSEVGTTDRILSKACFPAWIAPHAQYELLILPTEYRFCGAINGVYRHTKGGTPTTAKIHLAGTYDGTWMRLYQNGLAVGIPSNWPGSLGSYPQPLTFGASLPIASYLQCLEDHVTIYNRPLDPAQILNHSERRYPV